MSSVPSSVHAICLGKYFGSEKGCRVDAHVVALVRAITQPPLEYVIEVGIRAYGSVSATNRGVLFG